MPALRAIRIGARGSALARIQADAVAVRLRQAHPDREFVIVEVSTQGDRDAKTSLAKMGGAGVFVKEIETALLDGRVDIAVHSLKDMPTAPTPGLIIAAVPRRDDPRDALVSRDGAPLAGLPAGARVGTGSGRRAAQLRALRPDLDVVEMRGNVDSRLRKVETGEYDAAVLAMAGLARLGLTGRASEVFLPEAMLPAPGQGALAVQVRADDALRHGSGQAETLPLVAFLDDPATHAAVRAERAVLANLGGGCLLPIGAYGQMDGARLHLRAVLAHPSGAPLLRDEVIGDVQHPEALGAQLAKRMIEAGARAILDAMEAAR